MVNVPLLSSIFLEDCTRTTFPKTFLELFNQIIIGYWKASITLFGNILIIPIILFLSLILGLLITPLERLVAYAISKISEKILAKFKETTLFHGTEAMTTEFAEQLSWFLSNPDKKLHWEWELFHYYVYWSIFLNVFLFCLSVVIILWPELNLFQIAIYIFLVVFFTGFAVVHSLVMGKVHVFYIKEYKKESITSASSGSQGPCAR